MCVCARARHCHFGPASLWGSAPAIWLAPSPYTHTTHTHATHASLHTHTHTLRLPLPHSSAARARVNPLRQHTCVRACATALTPCPHTSSSTTPRCATLGCPKSSTPATSRTRAGGAPPSGWRPSSSGTRRVMRSLTSSHSVSGTGVWWGAAVHAGGAWVHARAVDEGVGVACFQLCAHGWW